MDEITLQQAAEPHQEEAFKELIDAGVFYGRTKNKTNPRMKPFIFSNRGGVELIDLGKTLEGVIHACEAITAKVRAGGTLLFVATQPAAAMVTEVAKEYRYLYVNKRWLGGTLTNFGTISKRIEHFKKLKADMASGALEKYTKKERLNIDRDIKRFEELLGGLETMNKLPDMVVVIDPVLHHTAVRETRRMKIPVVAFVNTDADPDFTEYCVVGNTMARKSIDWFMARIKEAIEAGKKEVPLPATAPEASNPLPADGE